jgi:hypothetical protein
MAEMAKGAIVLRDQLMQDAQRGVVFIEVMAGEPAVTCRDPTVGPA